MLGLYRSGNWNENKPNLLSRNNWRASLVPAAAVIPAPIAYINVVAVKKLVVGPVVGMVCLHFVWYVTVPAILGRKHLALGCRVGTLVFYCE